MYVVTSKRHGRICNRRNFNVRRFWCDRNIKVNMKRITYGPEGYDATKPNDNIVLIEDLPDPPPDLPETDPKP